VPGALSSLVALLGLGSNNNSCVQEAAAGALRILAHRNVALKAVIMADAEAVPGALTRLRMYYTFGTPTQM
jgi:hypothetical protein